MADDILHRVLRTNIFLLMCGSLLSKLGMPAPNRSMHDAFNRELQHKRDFDRAALTETVHINVPLLNLQQKNMYVTLMQAVDDGNGGIFFLDAKNKDVDDLNFIIQNKIAATLHSFKSVDRVTNDDEATNYPIEFLHSLDVPGLPPHNLQLKVGSVIIMPKLCNGIRLTVKKLMHNINQAIIIKGEEVLIPRIPMIPTALPLEFKCIQFPVRLAFAMTINKSQGQSLQVCGLNLKFPCFSHVACSRVGKTSALFVSVPDNKTNNVAYHKVLQ